MTAPTPNLSTDLDRAATFANDPSVVEPLAAAIERAALAVMAEDATTAGHTLRTNLAIQVLQNPVAFVPKFAWAVSTSDTIVTEWTGEQRATAIASFQFQVNAVWDAMANVVK